MGVPVTPDEADAILIVDPDAVLALPIASKRLKAIAWKDGQITKLACRVQLLELALRHPRHVLQATASLPREEPLSFAVSERPDHLSVRV